MKKQVSFTEDQSRTRSKSEDIHIFDEENESFTPRTPENGSSLGASKSKRRGGSISDSESHESPRAYANDLMRPLDLASSQTRVNTLKVFQNWLLMKTGISSYRKLYVWFNPHDPWYLRYSQSSDMRSPSLIPLGKEVSIICEENRKSKKTNKAKEIAVSQYEVCNLSRRIKIVRKASSSKAPAKNHGNKHDEVISRSLLEHSWKFYPQSSGEFEEWKNILLQGHEKATEMSNTGNEGILDDALEHPDFEADEDQFWSIRYGKLHENLHSSSSYEEVLGGENSYIGSPERRIQQVEQERIWDSERSDTRRKSGDLGNAKDNKDRKRRMEAEKDSKLSKLLGRNDSEERMLLFRMDSSGLNTKGPGINGNLSSQKSVKVILPESSGIIYVDIARIDPDNLSVADFKQLLFDVLHSTFHGSGDVNDEKILQLSKNRCEDCNGFKRLIMNRQIQKQEQVLNNGPDFYTFVRFPIDENTKPEAREAYNVIKEAQEAAMYEANREIKADVRDGSSSFDEEKSQMDMPSVFHRPIPKSNIYALSSPESVKGDAAMWVTDEKMSLGKLFSNCVTVRAHGMLKLNMLRSNEIPLPRLQVKIPTAEIDQDTPVRNLLQFVIRVHHGKLEWVVYRSFAEIKDLHNQIMSDANVKAWFKTIEEKEKMENKAKHDSEKGIEKFISPVVDIARKSAKALVSANEGEKDVILKRKIGEKLEKPKEIEQNPFKVPKLPDAPNHRWFDLMNKYHHTYQKQRDNCTLEFEEYLNGVLNMPPVADFPPACMLQFLGMMSNGMNNILHETKMKKSTIKASKSHSGIIEKPNSLSKLRNLMSMSSSSSKKEKDEVVKFGQSFKSGSDDSPPTKPFARIQLDDTFGLSLPSHVSAIHVTRLADIAEFGDIVLFRSSSIYSVMQRAITKNNWDHVGMVVRRPFTNCYELLEATGDGLSCFPLAERLVSYSNGFVDLIGLRKLYFRRSKRNLALLARFASKVEGKSYSLNFSTLLNGMTSVASATGDHNSSADGNDGKVGNASSKGNKKESNEPSANPIRHGSKKSYFCSELVAEALRVMELLPAERPASYYWPSSFDLGKEIDVDLEKQKDKYGHPMSRFGDKIYLIDTTITPIKFMNRAKGTDR